MASFSYKTKNGENPKNRPRIYFTCHPEDLSASFEKISNDIFKTHDCAIYYTRDMTEPFEAEDLDTELGQMNLFVVPVTAKLLTQPNRTMDVDISYAKQAGIPILPFMMEEGLDELYSKPENFGQRQYLDPYCTDITAIRYEEKLKKHLESVLLSDALAKRVRAAFDAYIFLSYRKKDRRYANELMKLIHKNPECRDIAIWYDEFLTPGESFVDSIQKALKDSKLFALLVTPNLLEEPEGKPNYVMAEEYPAAKRAHLNIFPAEMEDTDHAALAAKFEDLPACVKPKNEETFKKELLQAVRRVANVSNDDEPEHCFLVGLAYFEGIDMEVDRQRGLALITSAAEAGLVEAAERLIHIYKDGKSDQQQVLYWSQKLADHYYESSFDSNGEIKHPESIAALFSHYADDYWRDAIRLFLLQADQKLNENGICSLYDQLLHTNIGEYSLLLDVSAEMTHHREKTQLILVEKILRNAVDGTCTPYGPLFWYIPEYGLYETAVKAAWSMRGNAKAAALVRDVCFIFGQYDRAKDVTKAVDADALYRAALPGLSGVRLALCELFYTGSTDYTGSTNIYPRCFDLQEALSLAETGTGLDQARSQLFEDELGLFGLTETNDNLSGLVVLPYDENVERFLAGNIRFVRGLILLNTDNCYMDYLEFFRRNIRVLYIPENCTQYAPNFALHMPLELSLRLPEKRKNGKTSSNEGSSHMYIRQHVQLPDDCQMLPEGYFKDCIGLKTVTFPDRFARPQAAWPEDEESPANDEGVEEGVCLEESCFEGCVSLAGRLILPENVDKIASRAFKNCRSLEEVIFPANVTQIGVEAFSGCTNLQGMLSFSQNMAEIKDYAFHFCEHLTGISFQAGIDFIGRNAFEGCSGLREVTFTQGMRGIGPYAFYGTGIQYLHFPKEIGYVVAEHLPEHVHLLFRPQFHQHAFSHCRLLEAVVLPDDLEIIPANCFEACEKLRSFTWPAKLRTVESHAFASCALTDLEIPDHVQQIGSFAFARNLSLTHVSIQNPSIKLGERVFWGCEHLTHALLPEACRHIDLGLPQDCQVTWLAANSAGESSGKLHLHIRDLLRIPEAAYKDNKILQQVTIADAVGIDAYAFRNCTALEQVTVPRELTQLGEWAFAKCALLQCVPFLPQVEKLGAGAFEDCVNLREAQLHDEIEHLEGWVFAGCRQLQHVTLPSQLKRIDSGAFEGCENLQLDGYLPYITEIGENAFADCASLSAFELPALETVSDNAFWGCSALTELKLGSQLHSLGSSAFRGCIGLQELHLEETALEFIDKDTFLGCRGLKEVYLPAGITVIGDTAFLHCSDLEDLVLSPDALTDIREAAFAGCKKLKRIDIRNVDRLAGFVFHDCTALEEVCLSPKLKRIEKGTFADCVALKDISFCEELTEIGERAFYNCASLRSIRIPLNVTAIGDEAFADCEALELVEISRNFQEDIQRIFGQIDTQIIHFMDTSHAVHQHKEQMLRAKPATDSTAYGKPDCTDDLLCGEETLPRHYDIPQLSHIDARTAQLHTQKATANHGEPDGDELLSAAVKVFLDTGMASVSMLQRRLKLGYGRAARLVDEMEIRGIVGPFLGSKPRDILITKEQWEAMEE